MTKAIFTSVKHDPYFAVWIKYYSRFFKDIFVIKVDLETEDQPITKAQTKYKFNVITDYPNLGNSIEAERETIQDFQKKLFNTGYDWVLYSHADEIVAPDPDVYKDLNDYIKKCDKDYVFCTGYNVIHVKDDTGQEVESSLDLNKPVLSQRKYWWKEVGWNKPLLSKVPLNWVNGFHRIEGVHDDDLTTLADPNLILFHLKQADYDIFGQRINNGKNYDWFYKEHGKKELIPERFKKIF